uniref:NADH-ubiquinone oxidoreductase chain 4 n=1 Tax=Ischnura elegans TaxID=197161 RepID=A0A1D8QQ08_ISCEL|nr:NADH dehydrogenase subunit 4 [Ischnura elegans]YP_010391237.1 NADH dehydrogenase subunit 4 [Ischnura asiatica]AOW43849.1 NADH dehydrogenase subunit 4 [Ischnura elegans]QGU85612.1 NADH dehydrogenase subunit 4 [Ischnura elegans]UPX02827.1 NADH dehydrogenase subunit 4 [Ischnura asiatica]WGM81666.1 NADH dehydrogenase subunit 4 [Ischnura elegans]
MLKFLFFILFMIPTCFFVNYWTFFSFLLLLFMSFFLFGHMPFYYSGIGYYFGQDILSYGLVLLSFWICCLMILASTVFYFKKNNLNLFLLMNLFLLLFLVLSFLSNSLFMFYLFFESSLIPTFFLILGWGYQPERMQAGIYLLFYTLFASLPLLASIFNFYYIGNTLNILMFFSFFNMDFGFYVYISMILAFLVKMPMFIFHLWLPKAHVEAPVAGSMILAGVLLKLGGYGLIRVFSLIYYLGVTFNFLFVSISIIGGVLVSLICLRQVDLKSLIAYSSVAHMGIVIGGLMTMSYWGLSGSYTLMIAHGLCSSGMFCLANISYERVGSRSLFLNKGLMNLMPSMTLWWFLLSSSNMAAPPTLNLLGEISLFNSLISWSWVLMFGLAFLSFFSAAYTLYLYSYSQHGMVFSCLYSIDSGYLREYLLLFLHWLPLNLLILNVNSFFNLL